ncbi:Plasmodium exported protein, unknown function [Plasmodium relictum]|uniref:Fam-h protein n=1 Tax=Plasmodium relictum TaxID=85471 RepID=A0A1J1GKD9_PLARL|nr:Plasmodium exported protein, unknown function [Plasmodium relictum]CRG85149.1 Plasmodium exported protein, unknown function [Plasmodium relictum]
MIKKNNIISNITTYSRNNRNADKFLVIIDLIHSKKYYKKEKMRTFSFPIKFFIFTYLIWILHCFNNSTSCKLWIKKHRLENILNLKANRFLSENENEPESKLEFEIKILDVIEDMHMRPNASEATSKFEIQKIDPDNETKVMQKKNYEKKVSRNKLEMCKHILYISYLYSIVILPLPLVALASYSFIVDSSIWELYKSWIMLVAINLFLNLINIMYLYKNKKNR